jgi:hypothetical protein
MSTTITRPGAILPVEVRMARKPHDCNDCGGPIQPGDKYELSASPPHRIEEYDLDHWLIWRTHYPRFDDRRFLPGCDEAAAYRERDERAATAQLTEEN